MPKSLQELSERQRQVAELLASHHSLKEIAIELGITESAVNKHISALKRVLSASTHRQIIAALDFGYVRSTVDDGCRKPAGRFSHLPEMPARLHSPLSNDPGLITFADAGGISFRAGQSTDWPEVFEHRIVPKWLDGEHAVLMRLIAVGVLLFAMLLLPVFGVAALTSISDIIGS